MKTCECGGMWHRHGKDAKGGERYRCPKCRRVISVRDGQIVKPRTGPRVADWRTEATQEART